MTQEPVAQEALARFARLPTDEARLIEALVVHRWFDPDVVAYTAADLGVEVAPERVTRSPFVALDRVRFGLPGGESRHRVRPVLATALHARMRDERPTVYRQAHRIAADYFHQRLDPLRTDRLTWYVHEIRHLTACRPEQATERLAAFAHDALIAGYAEAAGRAAAELKAASAEPDGRRLAGIVQVVAEILSGPSQVEHSTIAVLDDHLARYTTPSDPAAVRLVLLARDLVVYYTERPAPVTPLTALVVPDATAVVDPRGVPVLGGELRLLEDVTRPSRIITSRTQRVSLESSTLAHHQIMTKLATEDRPGRTMVLADLLPPGRGDRLDALRLSESGGRPVGVLGANATTRALAQGVHRLLGPGEDPAGRSSRAEVSRRLGALGWHSGTDELNDLLLRARQSDDVDDFLQRRIADVMRYTPVVAVLDVYPGLPSEVTYNYPESCTTRRISWGRVVVSLTLTLPWEVRNRLEFVTPSGLVAAGAEGRSESELVPVHREGESSAVQRFDVRAARPEDGGEDDGMVRIEVDLGYRLPDHEFRDVRITAALGILAAAFALFLTLASTQLLSVIGTILASLGVLVDVTRDRTHPDDHEPLHVHAGKRLRRVRQVNAALAITAVTVPNAQNLLGGLIASGVALLFSLFTLVAVMATARAARRPLPPPGRAALPGRRPVGPMA
ncbi:hypothetical protein [Streptomyces rishiriensis]|uniref:Uncharacterized protein n=1 Tax=Streptomyces rishiriensis TaxID=68264 RepID=A0ABU0NFS5_STRRH|nr:hypothetical protein [Streptomyces rishiriensis]MDQ0577931.1 hypothetical protein [Streptomyces rishiriensis]